MFMKFVALAMLLLLTTRATADSPLAEHPEVQGALAIVDAWIDGVRDYDNVPGISVGFVADQHMLFSKGYGFSNVESRVPANADTIYSVCSISKLFTSIGVMQMRDAGKLTLRDPVADHLQWYEIEDTYPQDGPVRVLGLLTHSSGLRRKK